MFKLKYFFIFIILISFVSAAVNIITITSIPDGNIQGVNIITLTNPFGGMFFHNDTNGNVTDLTQNVWSNFSGFDQNTNGQDLNGFTFLNSVLTSSTSGKFSCFYGSSFTGSTNNKYHSTIGLNGVEQISMENHDRISTGSDILSVYGGFFLDLVVGDQLTLMYLNEDSGGDSITLGATVRCIRIGD